ncbi:MAG TPA: hypothetical protein VN600_01070 [Gemmatimonadaceae bacterium]|nr:hypothetical protein [Gemmatimonadaceae bacterium]
MSQSREWTRAWRAFVFLAALPLSHPATIEAQDTTGLSIEASVGGGYGVGGGQVALRGAVVTDLVIALRLAPTHTDGALFGLARESQVVRNPDLLCAVVPPSTDCLPDFPSFTSIVALAGWEEGRRHAGTARLLAGLGYYRSHDGHNIGAQGRAELATPAAGHLALVGFARGDLLPRVSGGALALWAVGVGLRIE